MAAESLKKDLPQSRKGRQGTQRGRVIGHEKLVIGGSHEKAASCNGRAMRPAAPNLSSQRCIDAAGFAHDWNDWGGFFLHGVNCAW